MFESLEKFGFEKETEEFLKEYLKGYDVPNVRISGIISYFRVRILLMLTCGFALGLLTFMIVTYFG